MQFAVVMLATGAGLLAAGAEILVRGGVSLARRLGLTPLVVGLTIVAFGTSAPELTVSLKGSAGGHGGLAVGNVVGSNIFNVAVILGLAALISPIDIKSSLIRIDMPVLIGLSLLTVWLGGFVRISRGIGCVLVVLLATYVVFSVRRARREAEAEADREFANGLPRTTCDFGCDLLLIVGGLFLLGGGSHLFVEASITIARMLGVSEAVIGLTVVAAGTSLPELATSVVAALRRQPDISVGNIVGSNIFNILGVLGLSAAARPIEVCGIGRLDLWTMAFCAALLWPLAWTGRRLQRAEGLLLLAGYSVYLWLLWSDR